MALKKIIELFRDALSGKREDFTSGSINRAIVLLSIPMILEMVMESLFAVVDIFFVGQLGQDAIATVGLTESVITIVYSLGIGMSMAATAMVARRIGEKDVESANRAAVQAVYMSVAVAVVLGISGFIFAKDILTLMGAETQTVEMGVNYTRWMFGGNIVIMLLFMINGIFRGVGDAFLAMRALWIANILNMILDPMLIFGIGPFPEMGIEGAAIATNLGRACGVTYQIYHLFKGNGQISIKAKHLPIKKDILTRLFKVSLGGTGQFLLASSSWIFLIRILAESSTAAVAGYTVGIRVLIFTILPAWGLSNAAATLVGQNLGAGNPDRAEKSVWRTSFFNMIFLGTVSLVYILFSEQVIGLFTDEKLILYYGSQSLMIISFGYIFYAFGMTIGQSFNGAGDTRTPTILNFIGFWLIQIPLAYLLAITFDYGPHGVFYAVALAESFLAVISILVFRRGKWKTTTI